MTTDTQGTVMKRGDGADPEVFTEVAEITNVAGFGTSRNEVDVTSLNDLFERIKPGLLRGGSVTLNLNHGESETSHVGLRTDHEAATLRNFQIVTTDDTPVTIEFSAYVMSINMDFSGDDVTRSTVTLKMSDTKPTYT